MGSREGAEKVDLRMFLALCSLFVLLSLMMNIIPREEGEGIFETLQWTGDSLILR